MKRKEIDMKRNGFAMFETLVVLIVIVWASIMTGCMYFSMYSLVAQTTTRLDSIEDSVAEVIEIIDIPEVEVENTSEPAVAEAPAVVYFDIPLSEDLQNHIFEECEKYGLAPEIVIAMIERESRFDIDAVGDSGRSKGLMQIQERWHSERMAKLGCDNLLDPYQNVTVGINFIAELMDRGRGVEWALMAYNGGPSYANRLSGNGTVSDYAASVIASACRVERVTRV